MIILRQNERLKGKRFSDDNEMGCGSNFDNEEQKNFTKIKPMSKEYGEDSSGKYSIVKYCDPKTGKIVEEKNYIKKPKVIMN